MALLCLAYPPYDLPVYDFFQIPLSRSNGDGDALEYKYTAFFLALFECAVDELDLALHEIETFEPISDRWRQYLATGAKRDTVGEKRKNFYGNVTRRANAVMIFNLSPPQAS